MEPHARPGVEARRRPRDGEVDQTALAGGRGVSRPGRPSRATPSASAIRNAVGASRSGSVWSFPSRASRVGQYLVVLVDDQDREHQPERQAGHGQGTGGGPQRSPRGHRHGRADERQHRDGVDPAGEVEQADVRWRGGDADPAPVTASAPTAAAGQEAPPELRATEEHGQGDGGTRATPAAPLTAATATSEMVMAPPAPRRRPRQRTGALGVADRARTDRYGRRP